MVAKLPEERSSWPSSSWSQKKKMMTAAGLKIPQHLQMLTCYFHRRHWNRMDAIKPRAKNTRLSRQCIHSLKYYLIFTCSSSNVLLFFFSTVRFLPSKSANVNHDDFITFNEVRSSDFNGGGIVLSFLKFWWNQRYVNVASFYCYSCWGFEAPIVSCQLFN